MISEEFGSSLRSIGFGQTKPAWDGLYRATQTRVFLNGVFHLVPIYPNVIVFVCISFAGPNATSLDLSVVGDIPINNETPMVTSSVSSRGFVGPVFEGAHMGSICVDVL